MYSIWNDSFSSALRWTSRLCEAPWHSLVRPDRLGIAGLLFLALNLKKHCIEYLSNRFKTYKTSKKIQENSRKCLKTSLKFHEISILFEGLSWIQLAKPLRRLWGNPFLARRSRSLCSEPWRSARTPSTPPRSPSRLRSWLSLSLEMKWNEVLHCVTLN